MCQVTVTVRFLGNLAGIAGQASFEMKIAVSFEDSKPALKKAIEARIGQSVLYQVILNGVSLGLLDREHLSIVEGDEFVVAPVILGG